MVSPRGRGNCDAYFTTSPGQLQGEISWSAEVDPRSFQQPKDDAKILKGARVTRVDPPHAK